MDCGLAVLCWCGVRCAALFIADFACDVLIAAAAAAAAAVLHDAWLWAHYYT
jgi:hypothetical protein